MAGESEGEERGNAATMFYARRDDMVNVRNVWAQYIFIITSWRQYKFYIWKIKTVQVVAQQDSSLSWQHNTLPKQRLFFSLLV